MIGCCGQPAPRRRPSPVAPVPPNPRVARGVRLLYLGAGLRELRGSATGLIYRVADRRRDFVAHPDDVTDLLKVRHVILRP